MKRKQKECKSIYGPQTTQVSNYTILANFMNQQYLFSKNLSLLCCTKKDIFIELYRIQNIFIANIFSDLQITYVTKHNFLFAYIRNKQKLFFSRPLSQKSF